MSAHRVTLTNPFALPYVSRGSETLILGLATWLRAAGREASVLAGGPRWERYQIAGVPISLVRARSLTRLSPQFDEELTFIPAMTAELLRTRPDVVHSFLYMDAAAAVVARRPVIVSYGGIATASSFARQPLKYRLFRWVTPRVATIICPSRAAADHLRSQFGYEAQVVPNGLDTAIYELDREREPGLVLCAATPDDRRKRVEVLVDAFAGVRDAKPLVRLVLAGRCSAERQRELTERLPERHRGAVEFTGDLSTDELAELYARADLSCLPSVNEAFGMVVVESLAAGTPVVAAAHGALPELVDRSVGSTFSADDVDSCASAILDIMERADDLRASCRERARAYDWARIGPRWLELYDRVA